MIMCNLYLFFLKIKSLLDEDKRLDSIQCNDDTFHIDLTCKHAICIKNRSLLMDAHHVCI